METYYEGLPSISHHETTALKVETSAKTSLQVADFLALESWLDMPGRPPKLVSSYFLAQTPLCSLAFFPLKNLGRPSLLATLRLLSYLLTIRKR